MSPSGPHLSIQESPYPDLTCFGCGHANPDGFHLRSYRDGDRTVATLTPRPEHDNGLGFLNGGINLQQHSTVTRLQLSCGRPISAGGGQRSGRLFHLSQLVPPLDRVTGLTTPIR